MNNVKRLMVIIGYDLCNIIYIEGKTDISLDEFLSNNNQIHVIREIDTHLELYEKVYQYLFEVMIFEERKFNVIRSVDHYIF